ncbi:putative stomatin-like protein 2, mitochondrial [Apostichopus japonicus]|uniref:Putative stomatin-like protein 2, mitochondrial n=1 Tax=Stichopus japonicus TaxID=307972 RepID=A0A2G8KW80_STIJA|nr:putative stomatin-like protein 2, mitochondrial [Apostichopus japonicus]
MNLLNPSFAILYVKSISCASPLQVHASYGVEDPEYAVTQLAQTTMRSEIGKISLDHVFKERESLNVQIVEVINQAAVQPWGIKCLRYEIKDIELPNKVREAMQMQVEAERKKRAVVLESEGLRESAINVAEGKKRAQILESEAVKMQQVNIARGDASAILARATASADGIKMLSNALSKQHGGNAASYNIAEQYVTAFKSLAKTNNTILLPTNTGDVTSMVASAMAVYKNLSIPPKEGELPVSAEEIKEIATGVQKAADSENSSQELAEQLSDNVNTQLEKRDKMQFGMQEKTLL